MNDVAPLKVSQLQAIDRAICDYTNSVRFWSKGEFLGETITTGWDAFSGDVFRGSVTLDGCGVARFVAEGVDLRYGQLADPLGVYWLVFELTTPDGSCRLLRKHAVLDGEGCDGVGGRRWNEWRAFVEEIVDSGTLTVPAPIYESVIAAPDLPEDDPDATTDINEFCAYMDGLRGA